MFVSAVSSSVASELHVVSIATANEIQGQHKGLYSLKMTKETNAAYSEPRSQGSSGSIVSDYGLDDRAIGGHSIGV